MPTWLIWISRLTVADWINVGLLVTAMGGVVVALVQTRIARRESREAISTAEYLARQVASMESAAKELRVANDLAQSFEAQRRRDEQYPERLAISKVMIRFLWCLRPDIRELTHWRDLTGEIELRAATEQVRDRSVVELERWVLWRATKIRSAMDDLEQDWLVVDFRTRHVIQEWVEDPWKLAAAIGQIEQLDHDFPAIMSDEN